MRADIFVSRAEPVKRRSPFHDQLRLETRDLAALRSEDALVGQDPFPAVSVWGRLVCSFGWPFLCRSPNAGLTRLRELSPNRLLELRENPQYRDALCTL
jgi:hypothetical protein